MPRQRTIKPAFFDHEVLCQLPPTTRLCFAGLWCWADKDGLLEDRPRRLHAQLFPYDHDVDMDAMLDQLAAHGFIQRYEAVGAEGPVACIAIVKFAKHQHVHPAEKASGLPPPALATAARKLPVIQRTSTVGSGILDLEYGSVCSTDLRTITAVADVTADEDTHTRAATPDAAKPDVVISDTEMPSRPSDRSDEAAVPARASPFAERRAETRHRGHAFCGERPTGGALCVPAFLHDEFVGCLGERPVDLRAWYAQTVRALGDAPLRVAPLVYWRRQFEHDLAGHLTCHPPARAAYGDGAGQRREARAPNLWTTVLERIEFKVNRNTWYTWFVPTGFVEADDTRLVVGAPNALHRDWMTKHYAATVAAAVAEVGAMVRVEFACRDGDAAAAMVAS